MSFQDKLKPISQATPSPSPSTGGFEQKLKPITPAQAPVPQTEPVKLWDTSGFKAGFTGALKSIGGTAMGIGVLGRNIQTKLGMKTGPDGIFDKGSEANIKANKFLEGNTPAEKTAKLGADITQFFLPSSGANKLSTGMSRLRGAFVRTVPDITLSALQSQGDAKTTATTGVTSAVANLLIPGPGAKISSKIMSGMVPGYVSDVATGLTGARGEDRTGGKAFIPGAGTALGTALGVYSAVPAIKERGLPFTEKRRENKFISKRNETLTTIAKKYAKVDKAVKAGQRNGVDTVKILSETNLLNGAVDNDGLLAADRALANFDEFISPFEGKVREAIQKEGRTINISQIANDADQFLKDSRLPGAAKDQLRAALESDMRGFLLNGDQIPIESLHDTKIFRNSHSNYMDTGANEVSKEAARFFKEQVEKNVGSLDVANYNKELSKYYAVKDVIEALNKTRVQGGRLGKYFSSVIGTGVGGMAGGPVGAIVGAEAGSRIQGQMMSRALGGDVSKGLTPSSELINASRSIVGKKAIPDLVLPKSDKKIPDVIMGNQSNKVGNRQTSQATTMIPIKNVIPEKVTPKVATAQVGTTLTPKEVNDKKIVEQFGELPKLDAEVRTNIVDIIDDYRLNKGKNLELQQDASRIAEDFGIKTPKTYGELVNKLEKTLESQPELVVKVKPKETPKILKLPAENKLRKLLEKAGYDYDQMVKDGFTDDQILKALNS